MERMELYRDIAKRTQGDVYIGVVGPVRTGKSTFIKRFLDLLVLPGIENAHVKARVVDEMPQSAAGRTIMTTQPKFVPNEAVRLELGDNAVCNVRMVDCVGYWIPGAIGNLENDAPRMVRTPWFSHDIPFEEAAEIGTRKVITDHATVGVVMTTDGSITELPRENYVQAEERVIRELQVAGKPFVIVVNSTMPEGETAQMLRGALSERYNVPVLAMDVMHMTAGEAAGILEELLLEFPMATAVISLPGYILALSQEHWLMERLLKPIREVMPKLSRVKDYQALVEALSEVEGFSPAAVERAELGSGEVTIRLWPEEELFYRILSEACGVEIADDYELVTSLQAFMEAKREYDRMRGALAQAKSLGYGTVPPLMEEMELDDPEITQQGSRYGVKLRARASGLQLFRMDIESEVNPIVGSQEQSAALVQYLLDTVEQDPAAIWKTNIFGKPLYDLVQEGMTTKASRMPDAVQEKLRGTLQRIVNDGCNGLICILL